MFDANVCIETRGAPSRSRRGACVALLTLETAAQVMPHVGPISLIAVPGVEGDAAQAKRFCDFVHEADAHGVDLQLASNGGGVRWSWNPGPEFGGRPERFDPAEHTMFCCSRNP